jgi:serine/threonine-protein kinase
MLAGETPFGGSDPFLILNAKTHSDPPPPRKIAAEIPPALEEITLRALERDPLNRYRDARELAWELQHQEQVAVGSIADRRALNNQHAQGKRGVFPYVLMGLIPLAILALLLYVAGHG